MMNVHHIMQLHLKSRFMTHGVEAARIMSKNLITRKTCQIGCIMITEVGGVDMEVVLANCSYLCVA